MKGKYERQFNLPRLHYVSQGNTVEEHLKNIKRLCEAGCPWIQLRLKGVSDEVYRDAAVQALTYCRATGALLTINDNWKVAAAIQADGIHVGKTDTAPTAVRTACPTAIIGATANSWEDVAALTNAPIDYIGLGPLRFTTTKQKLSPILGFEGYRFILNKMKEKNINIPVLAIGGIVEEDWRQLSEIGVFGLAASGLFTQSTTPELLIKELLL